MHFSSYFAQNGKNEKFLGLNANGLEIKHLTRYDFPHSDLYLHYGSKKTAILRQKKGIGISICTLLGSKHRAENFSLKL